MSCATAQRWFVSDHEFKAANEDIVFCNDSEELIKHEIAWYDAIFLGGSYTPDSYHQEAIEKPNGLFYNPDFEGRLMYGDAHLHDSEEWRNILRERSKEPHLKILPENMPKLKKEFFEAFTQRLLLPAGSNKYLSTEEYKRIVNAALGSGGIDKDACDYLIKTSGTSDQEVILAFLSGQEDLPEKRPVLLFLGATVDTQKSTAQRKVGLAYAYGFRSQALIMKTFAYSKGEHPFARSWYETESIDGYYLKQQMGDFIDRDLKLDNDQSDSQHAHLVKLTTYLALRWIKRCANLFELSAEEEICVDSKMKRLEEHLRAKPALKVAPQENTTPSAVLAYLEMRRLILTNEQLLREAALEEKNIGRTIAAENIAKYFERQS
ncbi:hypothetical protein MMC26_007141 [Xylographa opegraphella]|nr:hypothetical protein [Xylographa opegraphella]